MTAPLRMTAVLRQSSVHHHRGVVWVHPTVVAGLGIQGWSALMLTGARTTGATAALTDGTGDVGTIYMDDLMLDNLGVASGSAIGVARAGERSAVAITLSGPAEVGRVVAPEVLRGVLLGRLVTAGDKVSLLPQDVALPEGVSVAHVDDARLQLVAALGDAWQGVLLTVLTGPIEPAQVTMGTAVSWEGGVGTTGTGSPFAFPTVQEAAARLFGRSAPKAPADLGRSIPMPTPKPAAAPPAPAPVEVIPGLEHQVAAMREWLELGFHQQDLLTRLGTRASMGVLLSGPAGSGKCASVDALGASLGAEVVHLWAPSMAAADVPGATSHIRQTIRDAEGRSPAILLVEDVEAIAPRESAEARGRQPLGTLWREELRGIIERGRLAVVCTTTRPEEVSAELLHPGLLEHELAVPLPDRAARQLLVTHLTKGVQVSRDVDFSEIATRTPGFVYADLMNLVRQAGLIAAAAGFDKVRRTDVLSALEQVRPTSMAESTLDIAALTLDDVGDMVEVKQALTEAVLWPLRFPDTFARMGVQPPRGVLMYGPPGCGKTFLVKALAGSGEVNVLSVKGAELMSKYVGESEAGVRELFRRAREAAPSLIFLDEVDALAPTRGQSQDSGVTDRVVAALLTELDGVEELRQVVVVAATNRPDLVDPALTRPGRLERMVYVPPPDAEARTSILKASARTVPLAPDVDLAAMGESCAGFSSADLAALVREAAMTAMRRSMESTTVTAEDVAAARTVVKASLNPAQVASLEEFAAKRAARD